MGLEEFEETWTRVELTCDGLGDNGDCVAGRGDDRSCIMDIAPSPEGAHRVLNRRASDAGWAFELMTKRWLCPHCIEVRGL